MALLCPWLLQAEYERTVNELVANVNRKAAMQQQQQQGQQQVPQAQLGVQAGMQGGGGGGA